MKKINKRLRYVFTGVLLLLCTAAVVFAPSAYYSVSDNAMNKDVHITELGLPEKNTVLTAKEAAELFRSDDLIRLTIETDALTESKTSELVAESLSNMINGYDKNTPIYRTFDYIITNIDDCEFSQRSPIRLIGEIDGEPVSLTYITVSLGLGNEDAYSSANLYIDYNTLNIYCANFYVSADIAYNYGKDADYMDDNYIDEFVKHLARYWELPEDNVFVDERYYDMDFVDEHYYPMDYELSMDIFSNGYISEEGVVEYDESP